GRGPAPAPAPLPAGRLVPLGRRSLDPLRDRCATERSRVATISAMSRARGERTQPAPAGHEPEDEAQSGAFLLSQVGADAGNRFAALVRPLGLDPRQATILRTVDADPQQSQLQLSARLAVQPSRMVVLLDELEQKGYIERHVSTADRRVRSVQ